MLAAPRPSTRAIRRPCTSDSTAGNRRTSMPTASSVVCPLSTSRLTSASCTAFHPAHTSRTVWRRERTPSLPVHPPAAAPAASPAAHPAAPPTRPPSPSPAAAVLAAPRRTVLGRRGSCHRPPVMVEVPALHAVLDVWWVYLAAACGRADTACSSPPPHAALHPAAVSCAPCDTVHTQPSTVPLQAGRLCVLSACS